jgi:hypothetical protein
MSNAIDTIPSTREIRRSDRHMLVVILFMLVFLVIDLSLSQRHRTMPADQGVKDTWPTKTLPA